MVHVSPDSGLFEICSAELHVAPSLQRSRAVLHPFVPRRPWPWPSSYHPTPPHGSFLRAEPRAAIAAPAAAVVGGVRTLELSITMNGALSTTRNAWCQSGKSSLLSYKLASARSSSRSGSIFQNTSESQTRVTRAALVL